MRAYKFLNDRSRSSYTGTHWVPNQWKQAAAVRECEEGIHACRVDDLAWWLDARLWEIELAGEVLVTRHKVAATRGRLVAELVAYPAAVHELGQVSAWRLRDLAVDALRNAGLHEAAARFTGCSTIEDLSALRRWSFDNIDQDSFAGPLATFAADAARFVDHGAPAEAPFVACCAAGHVATLGDATRQSYDDGYGRERAFQSAWLVERLGLASD